MSTRNAPLHHWAFHVATYAALFLFSPARSILSFLTIFSPVMPEESQVPRYGNNLALRLHFWFFDAQSYIRNLLITRQAFQLRQMLTSVASSEKMTYMASFTRLFLYCQGSRLKKCL
ncbi:hypothetical protein ElyMa_001561400 [Elysia marginata]|uniref:Secreted protein n=1 Tax=Elysia marginata TaxID=1093978 RepID=A0AAV4JDV2_9GAST|nr:hypothetical protein ElyMa_001561400 [Elysia marginata]